MVSRSTFIKIPHTWHFLAICFDSWFHSLLRRVKNNFSNSQFAYLSKEGKNIKLFEFGGLSELASAAR